jgi:hypothetical protein
MEAGGGLRSIRELLGERYDEARACGERGRRGVERQLDALLGTTARERRREAGR